MHDIVTPAHVIVAGPIATIVQRSSFALEQHVVPAVVGSQSNTRKEITTRDRQKHTDDRNHRGRGGEGGNITISNGRKWKWKWK